MTDGRGQDAGDGDGEAHLTFRELEVAGHVARGLSNRQVANRLFLSERTVESHVQAALRKLGLNSRRELTQWVIARAAGPADVVLPDAPGKVVGRSADLTALRRLVGERRLVTLVGPAGIGKTRLALAAARGHARFTRVRHVDLAAIDTPQRVDLEVHGQVEAVQAERALLVLDNCEHLAGATAAAVERGLAAAPALTVLCTSREPLGAHGEAVYRVGPLSLDDSVKLLVELAHPEQPGPAAVEVCRRLDGIPLAIELAAARLRVVDAGQLTRLLDASVSVLAAPRAKGGRHDSIEVCLLASLELLDGELRTAFARLGVFPSTFDLDLAGAVGAPTTAVLALADASLVHREDGEHYRLLFPVRQFALGLLRDAGAEQEATEAHDRAIEQRAGRRGGLIEWYVRDAPAARLWPVRESVWATLRRLEAASPDRFVALGSKFAFALLKRAHAEETRQLCLGLVAAARPGHPDLALVHAVCAMVLRSTGDLEGAVAQGVQARQIALEAGQHELAALALLGLGVTAAVSGDHDAATRAFDEGLALDGLPAAAAGVFWNAKAMHCWHIGQYTLGVAGAERALELVGDGGPVTAIVLDTLGRNLAGAGRFGEAEAATVRAAALALEHGGSGLAAPLASLAARCALERGDELRAATLAAAAARHAGARFEARVVLWPDDSESERLARHPDAAAAGRRMNWRQVLEAIETPRPGSSGRGRRQRDGGAAAGPG